MKTASAPKRPAARGRRPESIDAYLAAVPDDQRRALGKLRMQIKAAAATATEGISYGVSVFKLDGRPLVGFGAAANHCSFYVMSTTEAMRAHLAELEGYELGKGSIRFPADKPLPAALVTKLVKARITELKKGAKY